MQFDKRISVAGIFRQTFSFVAKNLGSIVDRALLPFGLGWLTLFISISTFLSKLTKFVHSGGDDVASLVLAIATAGLLIFLFIHAVLRMAITGLVLEKIPHTYWAYFRVGRREWRLYGASLRLLLVTGAFFFLAQVAVSYFPSIGDLPFAPLIRLLLDVILLLILGIIGARIMFVSPGITFFETGQILRRSWRRTRGISWAMGLIFVLLFILGVAVELVGESFLQIVHLEPSFGRTMPMESAIFILRNALPAFILIFMVTYLVVTILFTVSGAFIYQAISAQSSDRAS